MPKRLRIFPLSGNKERSLSDLIPQVERAVEQGGTKYSELFLGSGSLLLNLPQFDGKILEFYGCDLNKSLVDVWNLFQFQSWETFATGVNYVLHLTGDIREKENYNALRRIYNGNRAAVEMWLLLGSCLSSKPRWNHLNVFNQSCGRRDFSRRMTKEWFDSIQQVVMKSHIHNVSWSEVKDQFDDPSRIIFLDPPYVAKVQSSMGEWSEDNLRELLQCCISAKAKVILTDIETPLHNVLKGWNKSVIRNMVSSGPHRFEQDTGLDECMWTNF